MSNVEESNNLQNHAVFISKLARIVRSIESNGATIRTSKPNITPEDIDRHIQQLDELLGE